MSAVIALSFCLSTPLLGVGIACWLERRRKRQRGSPCHDPAGNRTKRRPPDNHKETQTAVVWTCFPFIRFGQNHLARHSERGKKTRLTKEEVGRQHQRMDGPGVRQVPEGGGEQGKMEKTGCKIICGAPTTLAVKGLMMMSSEYWYSNVNYNVYVECSFVDRGTRERYLDLVAK